MGSSRTRGASTTQGGPSRSIRTRRRELPARRASSLSDEAREHIHLTAKEGRVWWTRVILCVSSGVDCPRTALRGLGPQVSGVCDQSVYPNVRRACRVVLYTLC